MIDIFKALSDDTRLRILSLIWNGEMCVCEIEKSLRLTQSNASRHLTILKNAGMLTCSKQAQWAYFKLNEDFFEKNKELYEYLDNNLKRLPTYKSDTDQMLICKKQDLCKPRSKRGAMR